MKQLFMGMLVVIAMVSAKDSRFKLGYAGTYEKDIPQNGVVIGLGSVDDNDKYIGGDISLEFYSLDTTYYTTNTKYSYKKDSVQVDMTMNTLTPAFVIGHKYIRFSLGIPFYIVNHKDGIAEDRTLYTGITLGAQALIPFKKENGIFIEPAMIMISGGTAFALRVGYEF